MFDIIAVVISEVQVINIFKRDLIYCGRSWRQLITAEITASKMKNPITTPSSIAKKGQRSFMIPLIFVVTSLKAVDGSVTIMVSAGAGPASQQARSPFAFSV